MKAAAGRAFNLVKNGLDFLDGLAGQMIESEKPGSVA